MAVHTFFKPVKFKASVIIPNWNGKHLLEKCLSSLLGQTFADFEIILVDNGSMDGSEEYVKKNFPKVKLIALQKNLGFAPAVNIGIEQSQGEFLILINNDTETDPKCIEYLVKAARDHPEVGMVAAKMLQFFDPKKIDSAGDFIDACGHANNIGLGKSSESLNREGYVFLVTGGGGLFKRTMLEKVGFLDDDYFAYFEDVDLCLRAQLMGYKGWLEPKAVIYHIHKATSSKNKAFTEYLQFRNMTMNLMKNFPMKLLLHDFNFLKIILVNINTIRYLASIGYLKSALQAEVFIIKNFIKILRKRKEVQRKKQVDDDYIIKNVVPKKITFFGLFKKGI